MMCLVGGGEGMKQRGFSFSHIVVPVAQVKSYQSSGQRRWIACNDPSLNLYMVLTHSMSIILNIFHLENTTQSFKISEGIPNRSRLESWTAKIQESDFCMNKLSLGWSRAITVIKIRCKCWI